MAHRGRTKSKHFCGTFTPQSLPCNTLPTYRDVLQEFLLKKKEAKSIATSKFDSSTEIKTIALRLQQIWKKVAIPIISLKSVQRKIDSYIQKYEKLLKCPSNRESSSIEVKKREDFYKESKVLFDIACCKCTSYATCNCDDSNKVPPELHFFLDDQRTIREKVIRNALRKIYNSSKNIDVAVEQEVEPEKQANSQSSISSIHSFSSHEMYEPEVIDRYCF